MPTLSTPQLGVVEYSEQSVIEFAGGLPAFEQERRFVTVERASTTPVVFLQSLQTPDLVFMAIPVHFVLPGYQLCLSEEELEELDLKASWPESPNRPVVLGIVTVAGGPATVNLMAPVVINPVSRRALQAVQGGLDYSCRHPLEPVTKDARCL